MNIITKLEEWANGRINVSLDLWRILFGIFLFYKGISIFANKSDSFMIISSLSGSDKGYFLLHFIVTTHVITGIFIAIGFLSRISTMMILPILIAAVVANFIGMVSPLDLLQAIAALVSCLCFMNYGSGKHSADHLLKIKA